MIPRIATAIGLWAVLLALNADAAPMGRDEARHLLNRTGIGAPQYELVEFARLSREQAIDRLLASRRLTPIQVPPALEFVSPVGLKNLSGEERQVLIREEVRKGLVAPHFVPGGRVRGGLYGEVPKLDRLDGNGNLPFSLDYRSLYATVLERWWGISSATLLGARYPVLELLRS